MRRLASTFAAALLLAVSPQAAAQVFPSKPITIVVPYSAGGGHDASARIVAEQLVDELHGLSPGSSIPGLTPVPDQAFTRYSDIGLEKPKTWRS